MKLARFLVEIRRSAEEHAGEFQPMTAQIALTTLVGFGTMPTPEAKVIHKVLAALAFGNTDPEFGDEELERLTPLPLVAISRLTEGLIEGEMPDDELRSLLLGFLARPN